MDTGVRRYDDIVFPMRGIVFPSVRDIVFPMRGIVFPSVRDIVFPAYAGIHKAHARVRSLPCAKHGGGSGRGR